MTGVASTGCNGTGHCVSQEVVETQNELGWIGVEWGKKNINLLNALLRCGRGGEAAL